jgi:phosphoenolpyruvate-protein kinase (PTS system EI component)
MNADKEAGIWVGCEEMAGDAQVIPILLGLGTDELSMAPQRIPSVKQAIRNWSIKDARELTIQFLMLDSAEEIRKVVGESTAKMSR